MSSESVVFSYVFVFVIGIVIGSLTVSWSYVSSTEEHNTIVEKTQAEWCIENHEKVFKWDGCE